LLTFNYPITNPITQFFTEHQEHTFSEFERKHLMSILRKLSTRVFTLSLLIAAFACTPALADPVVQITQCGTVISQPGHYILANDLSCGGAPVSAVLPNTGPLPTTPVIFPLDPPSGPTDGIDIVADHVDLLLNGHTIDGGGSGNVGISVGAGVASGNSHVHIGGPGTVTGFAGGIVFEQVSFSSVSDVTATNNGFDFLLGGGFNAGCGLACPSTKNDFQGNTATISEAGFFLEGATDNTLRDNNVSGTFGGIVLGIFATAADAGNDIRDNTASGNDIGILIGFTATDNDITHNTALNNAIVDMEDFNANCDSNTWKHNTFGTANQPCIN
jgi:parallel beta-helix repeat protein